MLCGGRKDGKRDKKFYDRYISLAEKEFLNYLKNSDSEKTR